MTTELDQRFMKEAIDAAFQGMRRNEGGPFGAVIVLNDAIIGYGNNCVTSTNDPTAHAEIMAIRKACSHLGTYQLTDCIIYSSCEPCPMCLAAIYWARITQIYYGCTRQDAAEIGFDDEFLYAELAMPTEKRKIPIKQLLRTDALGTFREWQEKQDKIPY